MKAATLAAHFATWRREHYPYPIRVPELFKRCVPEPMSQVTPALMAEAQKVTAEAQKVMAEAQKVMAEERKESCRYFLDCVQAELDRKAHPYGEIYGALRTAARGTQDPLPGLHDADFGQRAPRLAFDQDTWVTTASENSVFEGVTRDEAGDVMRLAHPANWDEAVPSFFKNTSIGEWDGNRGDFDERKPEPAQKQPGSEPLPMKPFQLIEHVEWPWRDGIDGGAINILEISDLEGAEPSGARQRQAGSPPGLALRYEYRLFHCVQTKFLATWEQGGLDVDEGKYAATWVPTGEQPDRGTLTIAAHKCIRYSRRSEIVPGLTSALNLMAPAITSMLMGQLAFYGVKHFLLQRRNKVPAVSMYPDAPQEETG